MEVPEHVWEIIEKQVRQTQFGTITLIIQDGCMIQIDKTEKIRIAPKGTEQVKSVGSDVKVNMKKLRLQVKEILRDLRFGQVVIVVKDNLISQIERLEKQRVTNLAGLFGDGI
ncbi:MAG: hypothetical protein H6Q67_1079 [Firmicutes bacterium]|nr:hypothetical protein [Bacillota bacterium]